ncbi:unnamed protein product [Diatraea saccharalis]|uniref:Peptidase S1 domain-containing protein n=1 Tax=Diatraea saccharalis TaxID=40085 RepID=A0A9N9WCY7_9NEOP|nr:unnamed protein product [Diatraea saccharalis]
MFCCTEGCGWRNPDGVGFSIKSEEGHSNFGEVPWMAALLKIENTDLKEPLNIYSGGGSLIHPSVVLTAAHLVADKQPEMLKIRVGEWDTQTKAEIYPHQDRNVASVLIHEDYDKGSLKNNIALLFLAKPVELAPNVGVVCLPLPHNKALPGTKCYYTGWGKDKFGKEGHYSTILKKASEDPLGSSLPDGFTEESHTHPPLPAELTRNSDGSSAWRVHTVLSFGSSLLDKSIHGYAMTTGLDTIWVVERPQLVHTRRGTQTLCSLQRAAS